MACSKSLQILRQSKLLNHVSARSLTVSAMNENFAISQKKYEGLTYNPGNEIKLKLYALFKQATVGINNTIRPLGLNYERIAMWATWTKLGDMPKETAKMAYVQVVDELPQTKIGVEKTNTSSQPEHDPNIKSHLNGDILVKKDNKVVTIILNRPKKYNAMSTKMFEEIPSILADAAHDDDVSMVVLTGAGKYFCSGLDPATMAHFTPKNIVEEATICVNILKRYITAIIDFPKPLIAAVNGPAIGISMTQLGLCDMVYVSDEATFQTPFVLIGQSPEACSSYTFPKIMGHAKACGVLLSARRLNSAEAEQLGLVTKVFPHTEFQKNVEKEIGRLLSFSEKALIYSKQLMRANERERLHEVNNRECERVLERIMSKDSLEAVRKAFSSGKAKRATA